MMDKNRLDLAGCELGSQASCCNYGNELLGFTKFRQVLDQMGNHQLVKATAVCSCNHSSNVSSFVSTPVGQHT